MSVLSEQSSRTFAGGAATEFATGFMFLDSSHLTVTVIDSNGDEDELVEGVDYTVTGEGVEAGGTVITTGLYGAVAVGSTLLIERNTPILQEVVLRRQGAFEPRTIMGMVDKLTLIAQENRRRIEELEAITTPAAVSAGTIVFTDKTFLTDAEAIEEGFPMNVAVTGGSTATDCWATRLVNDDDPTEVFDDPPAIQWEPGAGNNVSIKRVSGLKPGTNYTLRIATVIP